MIGCGQRFSRQEPSDRFRLKVRSGPLVLCCSRLSGTSDSVYQNNSETRCPALPTSPLAAINCARK